MTTLVERLRQLAGPCVQDSTGCVAFLPSPTDDSDERRRLMFHRGEHVAFKTAADLVGADPLYKAAPKLREILQRIAGQPDHAVGDEYIDTYAVGGKEIRDLLATLPKEGT